VAPGLESGLMRRLPDPGDNGDVDDGSSISSVIRGGTNLGTRPMGEVGVNGLLVVAMGRGERERGATPPVPEPCCEAAVAGEGNGEDPDAGVRKR